MVGVKVEEAGEMEAGVSINELSLIYNTGQPSFVILYVLLWHNTNDNGLIRCYIIWTVAQRVSLLCLLVDT